MNNSNGYKINSQLCNLSAPGTLKVCDKTKKSDSLLNSECLSIDINDDMYETDCSSVNINKFDFYSIDDGSDKMLIDDGDSVNDDVANFAEIIVDNSNVPSSPGFFLNSRDNSPHFNVGGNNYTITHNGNLSAVDACKDSRVNNGNDSKNSPIMLTMRGKTCRSLQHLTDEQLKIVSQILRQESKNTSKCKSYRSTYVDQQRGTSVLYKVMKVDQSLVKEIPNKNFTIKMGRPSKCQIELQKSLKEEEENRDVIVARTRSGRLSKLPRHISQNYKQIKETYEQTTANSTDHNQSTVLSKDSDQTKQDGENKLLGPLGPNKRHFSSTSLCPTCGKVYLGYKRMAIHFEKYPDHRDEEFLNNLKNMRSIDYGDKDSGNFVLNNVDQTQNSSQITNGLNESIPVTNEPANKVKSTAKKKNSGCKNCKFNVSYKNASSMLKKILTLCDPNEVIKYAGPIVTSVMNMWELLVMRIKQLKNDKETFAEVLLKEVRLVLEKIKTLSCQLITPLLEEDNKENIPNKLKIEEVDILQHVLGVRPGVYVTLENENWLPSTNGVDNNFIKACRKRPAIKLDSNINGGYESIVTSKGSSAFEAVGEHVSSKSNSNTMPVYSNPVRYNELEDDNERNFIDILREMESTEKCAASDNAATIATGSNNSASDISSSYPQSHFDSSASIQNRPDYSSALGCKVNNINNNNESVINTNGDGMFYEVEVTDSIFENAFMSSSATQNNSIDSKISNTKHNNNGNNNNSNNNSNTNNNNNNNNNNTNTNSSSGNINSLVTISDLNTADYIMIDFNNKSFSPPSISNDDISSLPHFDTFASHNSNTSSIDIMNELALSLSNEEGSANKSSLKRSLNSNDFLNTLRHLDSSNDSIIQQLGTSINSNTSTDVLNHNESFRNCFTTNNHCHLDDDTLSSVDILDFSQSLNSNFHHSRSS